MTDFAKNEGDNIKSTCHNNCLIKQNWTRFQNWRILNVYSYIKILVFFFQVNQLLI